MKGGRMCELTAGSLFAAVCTGALTQALAALRSALAVAAQNFPRPAGRCRFHTKKARIT